MAFFLEHALLRPAHVNCAFSTCISTAVIHRERRFSPRCSTLCEARSLVVKCNHTQKQTFQAPKQMVQVRFLPANRVAKVQAWENLLDTADSVGVQVDRDCLTGRCCRCEVEIEGLGPVLACGAAVPMPLEGQDEIRVHVPPPPDPHADADADADATMPVTFMPDNTTVDLPMGMDLLGMAEQVGVWIPRDCMRGSCYQCEVEIEGVGFFRACQVSLKDCVADVGGRTEPLRITVLNDDRTWSEGVL
mmetsp:Transcript_20532/g.33813  ORF Transcript_20532/g.33813 Transcript_20532/m.33813 type:complete len:247 (-) Transcript_20532:242-982(-)